MKALLRFILVLFLLIVIAVGSVVTWLSIMNNPSPYIPETGITFQIKHGDTLSVVASELSTVKAIRSSLLLRIIGKIKKTESLIKIGTYRIEPGMSTLDIHNLLVSGRQKLYRVTIPEGWTISRIAAAFEDAGITTSDRFLEAASDPDLLDKWQITGQNVEGFLYPDTYFFQKEYPAYQVVDHLLETFFSTLDSLYPEYRSLPKEELYKKIILASIVEREYRAEDEAPLIASVFYNRLKIGMPLQSCATVVYVISEIQNKPHPDRLFYSDLEIPSPYNTYRNKGLPPAPIANPGPAALKAVFIPAKTDYLYFVVSDPDAGRHQFSRTLTEHNRARDFLFTKRRSQ